MTVDLTQLTGLPVTLHDDGRLTFAPDVEVQDAGVRLVRALCRVAYDEAACEAASEDRPAYFMYNGVARQADKARITNWGLRYELTSIPAGCIGPECMKTLGHRHKLMPGKAMRDAEVCEVVHGTAHFLFEFPGERRGETPVVYYVEAGPGDKVLFPPDTLHCTINPGAEPAVFTDVVVQGLSGDYADFQATQGASYIELCQEGQAPCFIPNPRYRSLPPLRRVAARDWPEQGITKSVPLYTAFLEHGPAWAFLKDPELFWPTFAELRGAIGL
jgi:glucose-6-phosphate isomerase